MESTDSHWLQIKQDWLPIEAILNDLVPSVQSAKEKIDAHLCGSSWPDSS